MSTSHTTSGPGREDDWYEIRIQGHLDQRWASWFDELTLSRDPDGTTLLRGRVADQAALHGLLTKVRDIGQPLISVTRGHRSAHDSTETATPSDTRHTHRQEPLP